MASPTADEAKTIKDMNTDVERIRKIVRVQDPYFMTCAGSYGNRHHKHVVQARLERKDMPFDEDEDHLQYGTWVFRDNPGMVGHSNSCIILHAGFEEIERRRKKTPPTSVSPASLSASSDPKVRVSYKEYQKRKQEGVVVNPETKPVAVAAGESAANEQAPTVNGVQSERTGSQMADVTDGPATLERNIKRAREEDDAADNKDQASHGRQATKRLRISPPPISQVSNGEKDSWRNDLPKLLSPAQDPKKNPPHGLKPLLSPLPNIVSQRFYDDFCREKDRIAEDRAKKAQNLHNPQVAVSSDEVATPPPSARVSAKHSSKLSQDTKIHFSEPESHPSLIVVLKFGRRRRKIVDRILHQPSSSNHRKSASSENTRKLALERSESRNGRSTHPMDTGERELDRAAPLASEVQRKPKARTSNTRPALSPAAAGLEISSLKKSPAKRKLDEDEAESTLQSRKQPQIPHSGDRNKNPQTPNNPSLLSPASYHHRSDSIKSQAYTHLTATPLKDVRSSGMTRTMSQESYTSTPRTSQATPNPSNRTGPTSNPIVNGMHFDASHLTQYITHLRDTGKKLKTRFSDTQNRLASRSNPTTATDRKLGAVLGLESLLAYVLAFAAEDALRRTQKRKANFANWTTLRGLFDSIKRLTREFAPLNGLQHHVGAAICHRIAATWADRPSVERAAHVNEVGAALGDVQAWSLEAWNKLSLDDIINAFPRTWAKRARGDRELTGPRSTWEGELIAIAAAVKDGGEVAAGSFWLPLAPDSGPLQCVRFALSVLEEYAAREGLEYGVSLKV